LSCPFGACLAAAARRRQADGSGFSVAHRPEALQNGRGSQRRAPQLWAPLGGTPFGAREAPRLQGGAACASARFTGGTTAGAMVARSGAPSATKSFSLSTMMKVVFVGLMALTWYGI
jgi:hypothetical protein